MSSSTFQCLAEERRARNCAHVEIIHPPLDTIKAGGGGNARCMIAEIFLPRAADGSPRSQDHDDRTP